MGLAGVAVGASRGRCRGRGAKLTLEPALDDVGHTVHVLPEGVMWATAAARRLEHCRHSLLRDVPGIIPSRSLLSSSAVSRSGPVLSVLVSPRRVTSVPHSLSRYRSISYISRRR
jgi:hypothetical protein